MTLIYIYMTLLWKPLIANVIIFIGCYFPTEGPQQRSWEWVLGDYYKQNNYRIYGSVASHLSLGSYHRLFSFLVLPISHLKSIYENVVLIYCLVISIDPYHCWYFNIIVLIRHGWTNKSRALQRGKWISMFKHINRSLQGSCETYYQIV